MVLLTLVLVKWLAELYGDTSDGAWCCGEELVMRRVPRNPKRSFQIDF